MSEKSSDTKVEADVAAYLHDHPDFFERHLELLEVLQIPHPSGRATSLIERQVAQLRAQNRQIRSKLLELVEVARENDRLSERIQKLTLALFDAADFDDVVESLRDVLVTTFHADMVSLRLFVDDPTQLSRACNEFAQRDDPSLAVFKNIIEARRPVCGRLKGDQLDYMFGEQSKVVKSAVVLPLGTSDVIGLLAIGSEDEERFQSGMGTVFLNHMGELVAMAVQRHLPPPAADE